MARVCAACGAADTPAAGPAALPGQPRRAPIQALNARCLKCGAASWREHVTDEEYAKRIVEDSQRERALARQVDPFDLEWI